MSKNLIRLIIFHHHLLPGGVTDVIKHSLSCFCSMDMIESITVVSGRAGNSEKMKAHMESLKSSGTELGIDIMPELDYLSTGTGCSDTVKLKRLLLERYSSDKAVWLIHNYHLGKNWAFTKALNSIAEDRTQRMIYQIHDYPECARYANLKELKTHIDQSLYPRSPTLRYCVINVRDYKIMRRAGMNERVIHLLENPVPAGDNPASLPADKKRIIKSLNEYKGKEGRLDPDGSLWLYPVRSIRRKNVLEGGFLAALQDDPVNLILTLPGVSAQEKGYSDLCEDAFNRGLIQGFWGTGTLPDEARISYQEMISSSDLIFSSSVQEGFGYMYLNALLWKKPLIARSLDIMEGFLPLMKNYPALFYNEISVPADKDLKSKVKEQYEKRFADLQDYLPHELKSKLDGELHDYLKGDSLEFSYLSPPDQCSLLEKLKSPLFISECKAMNEATLKRIRKLYSITVSDKETELYSSYGEESYRKDFTQILDSFSGMEAPEFDNKNESDQIDKTLQFEFSKLEFLRLIYA
ncbi:MULTISPECIES: hypothetical protein [unclassified Oceanispirochaeta]|uniref:hypothetical protein n=1 Tax=unclassified Oceanispirochaeta TaxID=2635722 RepID=UPI0011C01DC6|nr:MULTISPECIES: hypothetical protein [unclassified Oceanispirochaeta]MBF9014863.1 hypothetical protein [Oceanispirochaeta sp. M2]NPD71456.1 hypothetical protein [Oceanispirochaeta sp. M1]